MTEFLKGYGAGANDMEAGRLVTAKRSLAEPYRGRRNDYQALSEYWAKRARAAEASALTAEEAEEMLNGAERIPTEASDDLRRAALRKLSLIANGERQ